MRHDPSEGRIGLELFGVFTTSLVGVLLLTRDRIAVKFAPALLVTGFAAGLLTLARFLWIWWVDLRHHAAS